MIGDGAARSGDDSENIADWMARRRREVLGLGQDAAVAGHQAWAAATRTGQNLMAMRPSDVVALDARVLNRAQPGQVHAATAVPSVHAQASVNSARNSYDDDLSDLRRQQAEFHKVVGDIDRQNSWMAIPALAPAAVVLGIEGLGGLALDGLEGGLEGEPLNLFGKEPVRRGGDTYATRIGRRAHADLRAKIQEKPGWQYDARADVEGDGYLKPDVTTPRDRYMELKPDTPSGRQAGERQANVYRQKLGRPARTIYYNPKDFR